MTQTSAVQPAGRRSKAAILAVLAAVFCALILYCRVAFETAIVSPHIAYVPIALAGLWFGRRGIWVAVVMGAFVVLAGLVAHTQESVLADLLRASCFLVVAVTVGEISERAARAREAEQASRRELERAQSQLRASERLASMGQLSAGVAHELNNPLGTILLYSHMLLKQLPAEDARRADLDIIASEATRCGQIVRSLLDFARQSRVSKAPTDLAALVNDVVKVLSAKARAAGASLSAEVQEGLPTATVDAGQVKQVLVNLVQNGLDAVSEGGTVRIRVRSAADGRGVEMFVEDNGCGIAPENMDKLFAPFFTTKQADKGTGLGLALAYGVVKMHSGEISARSELGQGTEFRVWLPLGGEAGG
jgi:two-component system NtrC family sensor kinase